MSGRLSGAVLVSALALLAFGMPQTAARAADSSNGCARGAVVREELTAPRSEPEGKPFTVTVTVINCTGAQQSLTLEGRQKAPGSCGAPVIDPLPVHLGPHQRFTLHQDVPGQSCTGTYTITWSVVRRDTVLAHRTVHIQIVAKT